MGSLHPSPATVSVSQNSAADLWNWTLWVDQVNNSDSGERASLSDLNLDNRWHQFLTSILAHLSSNQKNVKFPMLQIDEPIFFYSIIYLPTDFIN